MSDHKRNLWGDLDPAPDGPAASNPIVELLDEQAGVLAEITRGAVRAEVRPVKVGGGPAGWEFRLRSALSDYRYALFRVEQHALDFPATLYQYSADEPVSWPCADLAAFERAVAQVLKSPPTRKALASVQAVNRLDGARVMPIDFDDAEGPRAGTLMIKRAGSRTADGSWGVARVVAADGVVLQARFGVSGTVEATTSEDAQAQRIKAAVEALLARGERYDPEGEMSTVELTTTGAHLIDEQGGRHPL